MNGVLKLKVFFLPAVQRRYRRLCARKNGTFLEIILENCREVKVHYSRVSMG